MQYKSSYVRILDAKRRFLEAATSYYDLSQAQQLPDGENPLARSDLASRATCQALANVPKLVTAVPSRCCIVMSC